MNGALDTRTANAFRRAHDLQLKGRPGEAVRVMRRLARESGNRADILIATAQCELEAGDRNASSTFLLALEAGPEKPEQCAMIGNALLELGNTEFAIAAYERGAQIAPTSADAAATLAGALVLLGRAEEARRALGQALALQPQHGRALSFRSLLNQNKLGDADLAQLQRLATEPSTPALDRTFIEFAISAALENRGEFDQAIAHCTSAHGLKSALEKSSGDHYNRDAHKRDVDRQMHLVTEQFLKERQGYGDPSALPILVVGMPRSGTTLVEQIIASHPEADGAGELQHLQFLARRLPVTLAVDQPYPDCLEALTRPLSRRLGNYYMRVLKLYARRGKTRVVDKMWANYLRLALVALIAPNARVIHCRRDPLDTCVSCYFQNFMHPLPFLHDLGDLGFYYRQYARLMDHWAAVKPLPILDVDYETLVADQEKVTREIVAFCGLDWNDRCLAFHETDRFVQTASSQQVRRPIYSSSIERWRNYEEHLDPLRRAIEAESG